MHRIYKYIRTAVTSAAVTVACFGSEASPAATLDGVLAEAERLPRRIATIDFVVEGDCEVKVPTPLPDNTWGPPKLQHIHRQYRFQSNGNCYRVDDFGPNGNANDTSTYNGKTFQRLDASVRAFGKSSTRPEGPQTECLNPLSCAYFWLFPPGTKTFESLRDPEQWKTLKDRARFVEERDTDGRSCAIVEIERTSRSGQVYLYSVEFAKDMHYLPIAWRSYLLPSRVPSAQMVIKKFVEVEGADAGKITLPAEVEESDLISNTSSTYRFLPGSVHINEQIDADVFALSPTRADSVIDGDQSKTKKTRTSPEPPPTLRIVLIGLNILVVVVIACFVHRRYRKRSAQ